MSRRVRGALSTCMGESCSRVARTRGAIGAVRRSQAVSHARRRFRSCAVCGAVIRPHICWFGEVPFRNGTGPASVARGDGGADGRHVGSGGTGGELRRDWHDSNGARTIYVGPEEPANRAYFDEVLLGKGGRSAAASWLRRFLVNEVSRDVVGGKGRNVRDECHVDELHGGPLPSVGFATHHRQGGHALHGEGEEHQQGYRCRQGQLMLERLLADRRSGLRRRCR